LRQIYEELTGIQLDASEDRSQIGARVCSLNEAARRDGSGEVIFDGDGVTPVTPEGSILSL
jgi:hypothetical protein